ncbi:MAG: DUF456 domain-containing protein [Alistipes sp.]|jgi:uncharacterized protein YqgC (DUF456 family)|nr:DUF456 domain-containing protein [Alistipes sp.]
MDIFLAILAVLFGVVGLAGSVAPILPGPPVSWVGLLVLSFTEYYDRPLWFLLVWLGVVAIVTAADNILPVIMTKKFGGSRPATIGTVIGMIVGFFFGPLGMIAGPFVGAFLGELWGNKSEGHVALRVATGAFAAFICGTGAKLIASGMILYYMAKEIIV